MSDVQPVTGIDDAIMASLREICLAYPEAVEMDAFGFPSFRVRKKIFAMLDVREGRVAVWMKGPPGAQEAYIASEPDRYFRPPYFGPKGWVAAWVSPECSPDWQAIEDIIDESYRLTAPKRTVALLDVGDAESAKP